LNPFALSLSKGFDKLSPNGDFQVQGCRLNKTQRSTRTLREKLRMAGYLHVETEEQVNARHSDLALTSAGTLVRQLQRHLKGSCLV
jgi:hypothetical protein